MNIAKHLLSIGAVAIETEPPFTYASGLKGPIYCDNRLLLSYPEARDAIVQAFLDKIIEKQPEFDIVAGVATSAIAWAAMIAMRLEKPMIYIRASKKEHGKGNQIEGEIEEGKKVLVIEDLINSGGSSIAACEAVKDAACEVVACMAIVNYGFEHASKAFVEAKVPLYSLTEFNSILTEALERKMITSEQKHDVIAWHKDPKGWSTSHS